MTREQEIRHEVLLQLYGSGSIPISLAHIKKVARRGGFDYLETEIRNAAHFLKGQGFCVEVQDAATGEVRFNITSAGMLNYEK